MCCWLFGPLNKIHIPILCGSVENHDIFFKVCYKHLKSTLKAACGLKVMPMVKCKSTFGKWVGGEIENGSQKVNNYVVFPRVSMIIPAPHSRFFILFPHRWQQNFQTFGAVNNTTLNSLVKIKKIWLYQRVPDIRHGIIDLIFCRITPRIRVPRNRNHFSTERNRKKEKVETHTP